MNNDDFNRGRVAGIKEGRTALKALLRATATDGFFAASPSPVTEHERVLIKAVLAGLDDAFATHERELAKELAAQ